MFMVSINEESCTGCGSCAEGCPANILDFDGGKAFISGDEYECMGCEACVAVCQGNAISVIEM
jgi:NAD-dependent dihydropyrimidine dehydrogenase PreA subunit